MSRADDLAYFTRRFAEEMDRGDQAASASIAAIHYELAHRYSLIVRANQGNTIVTVASSADRATRHAVRLDSGPETPPNQVQVPLSQTS